MDENNFFDFNNEPGNELSQREIINDGEPLISIITPYYNAEKYVMQTAFSILNQTFPYFEWIIVNDGSTDENTKDVLDKVEKLDKRIKILNKENAGPAAARYYGVQNAKADIIFTIDADDLIDNTMLECGYFTLFTNPEATWAYTGICAFGEKKYLYNPKFDTLKEKKENLISVASFIRRDKFLELVEYATLPKDVHEDWYMWLSFLIKGYKPIKMNYYGFWYRRLKSGRLNTINANKEKTKIAENAIKELAQKVTKRVGAIQFPDENNYDFDTYPCDFKWNKKPINTKKNTKHIMFIFPWCVVGGADIFNISVIKKLKAEGYEITVITTETKQYETRNDFEKYADEFFDLTTFLKRKDWAGFLSYIIYSRNIDLVVLSNSFYGYYVTPWLKTKYPEVKFVDYLHAQDWLWRDGSYPRDSIAISKFLDKTYTCTNYLKDLMHDKMNKKVDNTEVIYIGTDTDYFNPSNVPEFKEENLKEKFKGKKVILFLCRIDYLKRPVFMVRVLHELAKQKDDVVAVVVGNGPAMEEMEEYTKEYNMKDKIYFYGIQKDQRPFYDIADVLLICSLTEGLTLTAYEALSMGVPVITSDVGGQKELIDEKCGRVIKTYQTMENDLHNLEYSPNEIKEYVEALKDVLYNENYNETSKYCRKKILDGFSQKDMQNNIFHKFNELIENDAKVDKSICNNLEFAERYLILFNEFWKPININPDTIAKLSIKRKIANRMWKYPMYRKVITSFSKKTRSSKNYDMLEDNNESGYYK